MFSRKYTPLGLVLLNKLRSFLKTYLSQRKFLLCSSCFNDQGLRIESFRIGIPSAKTCPNCKQTSGKKLNTDLIRYLGQRFFVGGTTRKAKFGEAPLVVFNEFQKTSIIVPDWLQRDVQLISEIAEIGFFLYGPRMWMVGEVEPLKALESKEERLSIIDRILKEYPARIFSKEEVFFRLRIGPLDAANPKEYDSPPISGNGRLDTTGLSILYGSQDLEVCIHECRATVEDELYIATMKPNSDLKLIDLTEHLQNEEGTEFESLDIAVVMLFLAGKHSYEISRDLAFHIQKAGYDGIIYPSYFSTKRTGKSPLEARFGISVRKYPDVTPYVKSQIIPNLALFGKPIADKKIEVTCINKLFLNRVAYDIQFGPASVH